MDMHRSLTSVASQSRIRLFRGSSSSLLTVLRSQLNVHRRYLGKRVSNHAWVVSGGGRIGKRLLNLHNLNSSLIHADIMQQFPMSFTPEVFNNGGGRRKTRS